MLFSLYLFGCTGGFKCRAIIQVTELQQLTKFFLHVCTKLGRLVYGYEHPIPFISDFVIAGLCDLLCNQHQKNLKITKSRNQQFPDWRICTPGQGRALPLQLFRS